MMLRNYLLFTLLLLSFNAFNQIDFKGLWQGIIVMDGQTTEQGNIIFINIPSNESVIEGQTREEINNSPYYAVKSFRGKINNNKLSFDQVRILKKESSSRTNWCLFKSELVYNDST